MKKQILYSFFILVVVLLGSARAQEVSTIFSERLNIYGYGLFDFCIASQDGIVGAPFECRKGGSFAQALFAPFLEFNITQRAKFLTQLELQYSPEHEIFGEIAAKKGGDKWEVEYSTKGADEVKVEGFGELDTPYIFFQYDFVNLFRVRAGKYLNPFGLILERRDAAPSYPFLLKPMMYEKVGGIRIMPFYNLGIQIRGEESFGGYVVHIANGRGAVANVIDANSDKAIGGHIFGRIPSGLLHDSLLGFDFYTDKDFKDVRHTTFGGHSILSISEIFPGKLQLWGEIAYYTNTAEGKPKVLSWYALLSYLRNISEDMYLLPYIMYDSWGLKVGEESSTINHIVFGSNFSPFDQLVFKIEFRNVKQSKEEKARQIFGFGIAYAF